MFKNIISISNPYIKELNIRIDMFSYSIFNSLTHSNIEMDMFSHLAYNFLTHLNVGMRLDIYGNNTLGYLYLIPPSYSTNQTYLQWL